MKEENNKQFDDNMPVSPRFLKAFLTINLVALLSFLIWNISNTPEPSEEDRLKAVEQEDQMVKEGVSQNPAPQDFTGALSGEINYTVDATKMGPWAHFNFSKLSVYYRDEINKESSDWDMAFMRAKIVTNGGETGKGGAEVAVIEGRAFEDVNTAEGATFLADNRENVGETKNPAFEHWYIYDFWTHKLKPKPAVYIVRTSDGHFAKFQIVDYYCGKVAACYRFRYIYQGGESRSFTE